MVLSFKEGFLENLLDRAKDKALSRDHLTGRCGLDGPIFAKALKKSIHKLEFKSKPKAYFIGLVKADL